MDSLNDYTARLTEALGRKSSYASYNKDMYHAAVVVCTSLEYAEKHVRLLSNKLDPTLYSSLRFRNALDGLIARGGRLDVLVETDVPATHPVIMRSRGQPRQVKVWRVPDKLQQEYDYNFMVLDRSGYRFEADRSEPKALVTFNYDTEAHSDLVARLIEVFEYLRSGSQPLS